MGVSIISRIGADLAFRLDERDARFARGDFGARWLFLCDLLVPAFLPETKGEDLPE